MLEKLQKVRLLVVGDMMLDRYWFGDVNRISPEAPVPVVKVEHSEERLGGAANVARNAAAIGGQTTLLSVVGDDEAGNTLRTMLEAAGINAELQVDPQIDTTVKLRVIGRQQQLLRIDFETTPSNEILKSKLMEFSRQVVSCDAVILSDYDKGGLTHISDMIRLSKEAGKRVLVDPKGGDWSKYRGATVITPNRSELQQVVGKWSGEKELAEKVFALSADLDFEALLLTRSEEGMTLYTNGQTYHQPAVAREVYDVSGAGDTVIATLAVMLAAGSGWAEAIRVATQAAGIVVGKLGTAVVTREELEAALWPGEIPCTTS